MLAKRCAAYIRLGPAQGVGWRKARGGPAWVCPTRPGLAGRPGQPGRPGQGVAGRAKMGGSAIFLFFFVFLFFLRGHFLAYFSTKKCHIFRCFSQTLKDLPLRAFFRSKKTSPKNRATAAGGRRSAAGGRRPAAGGRRPAVGATPKVDPCNGLFERLASLANIMVDKRGV